MYSYCVTFFSIIITYKCITHLILLFFCLYILIGWFSQVLVCKNSFNHSCLHPINSEFSVTSTIQAMAISTLVWYTDCLQRERALENQSGGRCCFLDANYSTIDCFHYLYLTSVHKVLLEGSKLQHLASFVWHTKRGLHLAYMLAQ